MLDSNNNSEIEVFPRVWVVKSVDPLVTRFQSTFLENAMKRRNTKERLASLFCSLYWLI